MARYKLPSGDPQFFGSRGGSTFQRCGKVFAIRKRNAPVQKKSPKQTRIQQVFGAYASQFRQRTVTEQNTWSTFSPSYPRTDSLGNSYNVQRNALFTGANTSQYPAGENLINSLVAPIAFVPISISLFTLDVSSQQFILTLSPNAVQVNCKCVWFVGRPTSGKNNFSINDLTRLGIIASGVGTNSVNWYNTYIGIFGSGVPKAGMFIPVTCNIIQNSSGQILGSLSSWVLIVP